MSKPPVLSTFASAQETATRWVRESSFYRTVPVYYRNFYQRLLRFWIDWYDGFVEQVHGRQDGVMSTRIAATIVQGAARKILRGGILFENADIPTLTDEEGVGKALSFISDKWAKDADFEATVEEAICDAFAGGTSFVKLNASLSRGIWLDVYRADRAFATFNASGRVEYFRGFLNEYTKDGDGENAYTLVEERYFKDLPIRKHVPVSVISVHRSTMTAPDNYSTAKCDWRYLPRGIRDKIKEDYGSILVGQERALPWSDHLGVEAFKNTRRIASLPGIEYGESLLANILSYMFSYDYYFSCLNTDMYLGRGRAVVPKGLANPKAKGQEYNAGLDSFLFTKVEYQTTEDKKIEPLQFALRSAEWREIRNNLIESMAFATGLSVGTLASFLNDQSNRTAREVSSEESATQEFCEAKRRQFTAPINRLLALVCDYYGFIDRVVVRWSRAGMTNEMTRTENALAKYRDGAASLDTTLRELYPDMDEYQRRKECEEIGKETAAKQAAGMAMFGDLGGATTVM